MMLDPQLKTEHATMSAICVLEPGAEAIADTLSAYVAALSELDRPCDLAVVCNGCRPHELHEVQRCLQAATIDTSLIELHQHCEESTALRSGIEATRGQYVAILPGYLQVEASDLKAMLEQVDQGYDYVASWRKQRIDARWNRFKSQVFNRLSNWLSGANLHDVNSPLRLMRREVPQNVPMYGDLHRFLPILAARRGFRITEVETTHLAERVRPGDYRFGVYLRRVLDLLTLFFLIKFTRKPLRFFGLIGSATLTLGALALIVLGVQRMLGTPLADRPVLILAVMGIVLGIQLFSLGLLGELIIFVHGRSQKEYYVYDVYEHKVRE